MGNLCTSKANQPKYKKNTHKSSRNVHVVQHTNHEDTDEEVHKLNRIGRIINYTDEEETSSSLEEQKKQTTIASARTTETKTTIIEYMHRNRSDKHRWNGFRTDNIFSKIRFITICEPNI
eukprot:613063_1